MLEDFKYFLKKHWYLLPIILLVSIPLLIISTVRTDQALLLKGDTTEFSSVLKVDTNYEEKGSFSTIYVMSQERSTLVQNWIVDGLKTSERYTMSEGSTRYTDVESYKAGKIQYNSSIYNAVILAYKEAMKQDNSIRLEYSFSGFQVTDYGVDSSFKIGDKIIKIISKANDNKESTIADETDFRRVINLSHTVGDIYTINRDGKEMEIILTEKDTFYAYSIYQMDTENTFPKISVNSTTTGGPSGGLLQTLSVYNQLVPEDLTHGLKIAGTGTISYTGKVGAIGGIREKVPTAFDDHIDVFFCVSDNYEDALEAYNSIAGHERMKLVKIDTFYDALEYLKEGYKNDFGSLE